MRTEQIEFYHYSVDSIEPFSDREKADMYRQALERIRDEHPAPASPGPCIVCAIVYGTLKAADHAESDWSREQSR